MRLYRPRDVRTQFKNFLGKSLRKTSYLGMSTEDNLHAASFFKLTKRKFALLTHCRFNSSVM